MSTYRPKNNLRAQITLAACPRLGEYIPALVFNSGVVVVERFGGRLGEVGNFCNRGPRLRATCRVTLAVSRTPRHKCASQYDRHNRHTRVGRQPWFGRHYSTVLWRTCGWRSPVNCGCRLTLFPYGEYPTRIAPFGASPRAARNAAKSPPHLPVRDRRTPTSQGNTWRASLV